MTLEEARQQDCQWARNTSSGRTSRLTGEPLRLTMKFTVTIDSVENSILDDKHPV